MIKLNHAFSPSFLGFFFLNRESGREIKYGTSENEERRTLCAIPDQTYLNYEQSQKKLGTFLENKVLQKSIYSSQKKNSETLKNNNIGKSVNDII